jgi:hypothetical protein
VHARLGLALALTGAAALLSAQAPAQPPAPLLDAEAIEQFLKTAKVVKTRGAGKGITGSLRATLSDGTYTHDAQIQSVEESRAEFTTTKGVERDFRDSWSYNVAAYRIAQLLDLRMVPVSVERRWNGQDAAFTWWLDDVVMDEEKRLKDKLQPPAPQCWLQQMHLLRMFDALIDNSDRNLGNTLYTKDWKIWAIDHTRAFRRSPVPPKLESLTRIDRGVLARLEALDFATLKKAVGRYLLDADIRLLLSRRDALVKRYKSLGDNLMFDRDDPSNGCFAVK